MNERINDSSPASCSANVGKNAPVRVQSTSSDWETPQGFFDKLNEEFWFTLDVCASQENAKCTRYFTKDDDGLNQEWSGVCWMNPPYGKEIPKWMEKAYKSSLYGATVVCLVPARTDTRWWHSFAEKGEKRFVKGRLKFLDCSGQTLRNETDSVKDGRHAPNTGAPFPSAVIVFRPNDTDEARSKTKG
jgi:phage N-6-adenine-methyltransferase